MVLAAGQSKEKTGVLGFLSLSEEPQATPEVSEYRKQVHATWPLSLEVGLLALFPRGVKMTHSQDSPDRCL